MLKPLIFKKFIRFTRVPHIAASEQVFRFKIGADMSQRPLQAYQMQRWCMYRMCIYNPVLLSDLLSLVSRHCGVMSVRPWNEAQYGTLLSSNFNFVMLDNYWNSGLDYILLLWQAYHRDRHFKSILKILRGRPFDPEWGASKFGRDRLFIFITGLATTKEQISTRVCPTLLYSCGFSSNVKLTLSMKRCTQPPFRLINFCHTCIYGLFCTPFTRTEGDFHFCPLWPW